MKKTNAILGATLGALLLAAVGFGGYSIGSRSGAPQVTGAAPASSAPGAAPRTAPGGGSPAFKTRQRG